VGGEKNDGQRVYLRKGARMQEWPGVRRVNGGADTLAVFATPPTESQPAEDPRPSVPEVTAGMIAFAAMAVCAIPPLSDGLHDYSG
jgi:hypothetical protein